MDEADPQNGYGVKEEVEKKDNRANYAYINFMKNKLRAGMGIKNPMVMVDPDKAKEKFEKMATSMTASTGEEEEKEGACEGVGALMKQTAINVGKTTIKQAAKNIGKFVAPAAAAVGGSAVIDKIKDSLPKKDKLGDFNKKSNIYAGREMGDKSIDLEMSDISKTIMERGITHSMGAQGMRKLRDNAPNIDTDTKTPGDTPSTPSPGDKPSSDVTPSPDDTPSTPSPGNTPSKKVRQPAVMASSYDPLSNKEILGISEKILKKNFNLGEEGYDIARDEGKVKPSKDKKDATSYPPSEEMKKTQKKNKGPSALEIVKKKYGKAVMDVDKKKRDKK